MSTLQIRKLQSGAFKHVDSIDGAFFLGRFNFKHEFNKAFLVEAYGAKRRTYGISDIEVYNYLGSAETFTNWTDLINRLVDLSYTGIDTNSIPSGGGVWGGISGTLSNQTDLQNALNSKQDVLTSTSFGTFSNSLTTDDTIPDAGIFNYTNVLGIQVKTTWDNIKAQLASIFQYKLTAGTNITIDNTNPLAPVISASGGGSNKRTVCFTYEFNGALNTATNNWWGAIGNGVPSQLMSNASLTPANNFSSAQVQAPAWVVPFNCRLKSIIFKGFSNTGSGVVDLAFTSGTYLGSGSFLSNNIILSNQPFTLHNYLGVSNYSNSLYVFDTGFTNYVIPKGYEIRMFMNNRNVAKNLLSATITVEFEEEI